MTTAKRDPIVVAKFGGSSLANAPQMKKVKAIVEDDPARRYVVVSAPGKRSYEDEKITDLLMLWHAGGGEIHSKEDIYVLIAQRFTDIVNELGLSIDIHRELDAIKKEIDAGASLDYCASRGEYLNAKIMAEFLGYDFVDAKDIVCFDKHGSYNEDATDTKTPVLFKHMNAVIPGFYGAKPDGSIKIFSRGGSDMTGAIIAKHTGADLYENWTDVSGILMCDPRIVDNPHKIETVTYHELRELSYMGADVLHSESVFPVRNVGIPINLRNTNEPRDPGTMIVEDDHSPHRHPGSITGISGRDGFTIITIDKTLMNREIGFVQCFCSAFSAENISIDHIPSGIDSVSVVVANHHLGDKLPKVIERIHQTCKPDTITIVEDIALVCVVGRDMANTPGSGAKIFKALADGNINVRLIVQGSSEISIIIGVTHTDREDAIRRIYNAVV